MLLSIRFPNFRAKLRKNFDIGTNVLHLFCVFDAPALKCLQM